MIVIRSRAKHLPECRGTPTGRAYIKQYFFPNNVISCSHTCHGYLYLVTLICWTNSRLTGIASLGCLTVLTQKDLLHCGYTKSQNIYFAHKSLLIDFMTPINWPWQYVSWLSCLIWIAAVRFYLISSVFSWYKMTYTVTSCCFDLHSHSVQVYWEWAWLKYPHVNLQTPQIIQFCL